MPGPTIRTTGVSGQLSFGEHCISHVGITRPTAAGGSASRAITEQWGADGDVKLGLAQARR
jgi:hypothetical protein